MLYDVLNVVSILNSSLTFILGAAAVLRLVLFARTPVVMHPNGGEDFYKMDNLNSWLGKEIGLDITGSVWVIYL